MAIVVNYCFKHSFFSIQFSINPIWLSKPFCYVCSTDPTISMTPKWEPAEILMYIALSYFGKTKPALPLIRKKIQVIGSFSKKMYWLSE